MKALLFTLLCVSPLTMQAQQSTEANAVVEKPALFTLQVTELTTSGFLALLPNGTKEKLVVSPKTEIKRGEKSAVFSEIKLGDVVTGIRFKKPQADEWEIVKITNFVTPEK